MATTILTKRSNTATAVPLAADLTNSSSGSELAVNTADKRLFTKDSGGTVVELGTNPSTLVLPSGSVNGVAYLNGSKVVTSGSALTFDGSNLGVAVASPTAVIQAYRSSGSSDGGNTGSMLYLQSGGSNANLIKFNGVAATEIAFGRSTGSDSFYWGAIAGPTEWMRLTSTGLGIGTSSVTSGSKLTIAGGNLNLTQSDSRVIGGDTTGRFIATNSDVTTYIAMYGSSHATVPNVMSFVANGNSLTFNASGNLGLGVTPSAWATVIPVLELKNGVHFGALSTGTPIGYLGANAYYNGTNWIYKVSSNYANRYELNSGGTGAHAWYTAPSGTAGNAITFTQAMTLNASGQLVINGTSVSSGSVLTLQETAALGSALALKNRNSTQTWQINVDGASVDDKLLAFIDPNAGLVRMALDSSGNLLVGTTSGSSKVNISSSAQTSLNISTTGVAWSLVENQTNAGTQYFARFDYNGSAIGSIQGSNTTTAYITSSDYRLKNTIAPMTGALAKVALLKPCTYKWNIDGSDGEGFIAHELAEVCPHAVTGEKDAVDEEGNPQYQGIDTSFLVATLTAAIQELKAEFDAYKASHP